MSFPHHNYNYNATQDYGGIPVAPPHNRREVGADVEMTDADPSSVEQSGQQQRTELYKSRSPGKRVVYYRSMEPQHIWPMTQQQQVKKEGIGN